MNKQLPDYRSKEDSVLYIIGNGFDLYHGLNTNYSDFYDWLSKEGHRDFVDKMQTIYPDVDPNANVASKDGGYMLWRDFEEALRHNTDLLELHKLFGGDGLDSLPIEKQITKASDNVSNVLSQIRPLLLEWAESFTEEYGKIKKLLPLGKNSKYITFNYTKVLEEVYQITDKKHVWHIHGSVDDGKAITGYDKRLINDTIYGTAIEEASERNILKELQKMRKPTEDVYTNCPEAFKSLQGIDTIIVIGHSLSDVDIAYFRYMLYSIPDYVDIKWQYWIHSEEAIVKTQERVIELCNDHSSLEVKMNAKMWNPFVMDNPRH